MQFSRTKKNVEKKKIHHHHLMFAVLNVAVTGNIVGGNTEIHSRKTYYK